MPKVLCDVDGVVCDLHTEWLRRYNERYDDDLRTEEIDEWDMKKFVKPECGDDIFNILWEEDLYDHCGAIEGAMWGVNAIRKMGHRVVFVTSSNPVSAAGKMKWLKRTGFLPGKPWDFRDCIIASDKSLVRGTVLIDDYPENIRACRNIALPIVFTQRYNTHLNGVARAENWGEVVDIIRRKVAIPKKRN